MWILLCRDGLGDRQVERREGSYCLRTGAQRVVGIVPWKSESR